MIESAGPAAESIERLLWATLLVFGAVFVLTMAATARAVSTARTWRRAPTPARLERGVTAAVGATIAILVVYLLGDLFTTRAVMRPHDGEAPLTVEVTGYQWWWEIEYVDSIPARRLVTANELHIPVGRPVRIVLRSADVIHSLWIPALQGKRDAFTDRQTELWLIADRPGVFQGRCAEFCGHEHALMGIDVVAEPPEEFAEWYEAQLRPAPPPTDSLTARGQGVFLGNPCAGCHTIRGTPASARVAPDLTHIASRRRLAAGSYPHTRGWLAGWILDPQTLKPGARMPANPMTGPDLDALLAYLETLR